MGGHALLLLQTRSGAGERLMTYIEATIYGLIVLVLIVVGIVWKATRNTTPPAQEDGKQ